MANPPLSDDDSGSNENMAMDIPSNGNGSNIVTMEPFQKTSNKRKNKYRPDPTLIHFDSLFGIDNWSRYLVLKTNEKISSAKLENILLYHCPTKEMSFRLIRPNEWLIEATTKKQSEVFQSLNELEGIEVSVKKHDKLNSIQGTVILPNIEDENEFPDQDLLLDSLKKRYDNVQDIDLYKLPNKKYPDKPLRIARIKFDGHTLPQKIKIQGQNREVRPYVPKPLQCKSCSKYGHSENNCRSTPVCAFCSSTDHLTTWNCGTPKCANCGLGHHSRAKECTFHIFNTELKLLVSRTGMSFREAKQELKARGFKDPAKNPLYKSKVENFPPQRTKEQCGDNLSNQSCVEPNNTSKTNHKAVEPVAINNSFEILKTFEVEVEIHQEDSEVRENNQQFEISEKKEESSRQNKRPFEKLSPVKEKENPKRAVKPKIQRNQNELPRKAKSEKPMNTEEEHINLSQVFTSKFKNSKISTSDDHKENCDCLNCVQSEIDKLSQLPHNSTCGCHECFVQECKTVKPLTKEKLVNIIRSFISNKSFDENSPIDSHPSGCMCKNHLIHYKKNKITILDKFLDQISGCNSLNTNTTN